MIRISMDAINPIQPLGVTAMVEKVVECWAAGMEEAGEGVDGRRVRKRSTYDAAVELFVLLLFLLS